VKLRSVDKLQGTYAGARNEAMIKSLVQIFDKYNYAGDSINCQEDGEVEVVVEVRDGIIVDTASLAGLTESSTWIYARETPSDASCRHPQVPTLAPVW